MNGLRILREVSNAPDWALASIQGDGRLIEYDDKTRWVDNDLAWDAGIGHEIVLAGGNFIITDAQGGRVGGPYRALDKAEAARSSAKVQLVSIVEDIDEEPDYASIVTT